MRTASRRRGAIPALEKTFDAVLLDKPADVNVIVGQSHFIKTIEDLHETLAGVSPYLRFGIAFAKFPRTGSCAGPATTPS